MNLPISPPTRGQVISEYLDIADDQFDAALMIDARFLGLKNLRVERDPRGLVAMFTDPFTKGWCVVLPASWEKKNEQKSWGD